MARTFNIQAETTLVEDFQFTGDQELKATTNHCERAFRFRFIMGDMSKLPKYIKESIAKEGYKPVYLGGTTYDYSVIGLAKI